MEKISIIMPVYNVEKFIKQSIDSVLNQTYKNFELILVDDGSKDSSGEICDEYKKIDARIKVIHQENGGLPVARNAGMNIATGKYMMFIDSDDFYEPNSCELLYNTIEKYDADYIIGNYIHTTYDGTKWEKPVFNGNFENEFKLSIKDYEKSFFVMNSTVCNKIFKRDFIEKNKLRFTPMVIAEDAIFSTYCYVHTDKGYFINSIIYNYRQNKENGSVSTNCTKEYFEKLNEAYKLIFNNFESTNNIGFYRFFYARIMPYLTCKIVDTNSLDDRELEYVVNMLRWFFKQVEEYHVAVINDKVKDIVKYINKGDIEATLKKIKETKVYRNSINDVEREKMYAPSEKLYKLMTE